MSRSAAFKDPPKVAGGVDLPRTMLRPHVLVCLDATPEAWEAALLGAGANPTQRYEGDEVRAWCNDQGVTILAPSHVLSELAAWVGSDGVGSGGAESRRVVAWGSGTEPLPADWTDARHADGDLEASLRDALQAFPE